MIRAPARRAANRLRICAHFQTGDETGGSLCDGSDDYIPAGLSNVSAIRRRAVIHGRVQGVFFRDTTRREAASRGVAGWVRNRPDGTVEAVFEGDPEAVGAMLELSRRGPRGARVDEVDVHEEEAEGLSGFEIR
jgi:acylphosphatase